MSARGVAQLEVGDELTPLRLEPLTRLTLALYAGASGDHNPLHIDIDAARAAGLPDVIAHGMLSLAYLGRLLTMHVDQADLLELDVRFVAMTHVGDALTCRARVTQVDPPHDRSGASWVHLGIDVVDQVQETKIAGRAIVAIRPRPIETLDPIN
jgi:acyl dehydratase